MSATSNNEWVGSMDKLWETASSDWTSLGKDLRAQLSEGKNDSLLSTGTEARIKVSVAMLSPPQSYMTAAQVRI